MKEHYTILEVTEFTTLDDIKASYFRLLKIYHPDVNKSPDAEVKSKKINAAWDWMKKNHGKAQSRPQSDPYRNARNSHNPFEDRNPFEHDPFGEDFRNRYGYRKGAYDPSFDERIRRRMEEILRETYYNEPPKDPPALNLYYERSISENYMFEIPQADINRQTHVLNILVGNKKGVVVVKKGVQLPYWKTFESQKQTIYVVPCTKPIESKHFTPWGLT